jgi:hypothetical protein
MEVNDGNFFIEEICHYRLIGQWIDGNTSGTDLHMEVGRNRRRRS